MDGLEKFIEKARKMHGDKYRYEKVEYRGSQTEVIITCPAHGDFKQRPASHLRGDGCPLCANEKRGNFRKLTKDEFIDKSREVHGDKYDYSLVDFDKVTDKVKIICPEHGIFEVEARRHYNGQGCPKCRKTGRNKKIKPVTEKKTVQDINRRIQGYCCSECGDDELKYENEIYEYVKTICSNVTRHDVGILNDNEICIYLPDKKIGIEFDGLSSHCEKNLPDKNYHLNKTKECERNGIRLIHIFEDEWLYKKDIVKSRIKNILGVNERIYARKCEVKEITGRESKEFINKTHIQGNVNSKFSYGLFYENELVAVMTFGCVRKNLGRTGEEGTYELLRFSSKRGANVIGGASKLLKYFIRNVSPKKIITYADRRWSNGNLYEKLGFTFVKNTQPSYFYVINGQRKNRFGYRKDVLISKYGCKKEETEHSFCLKNNWYRIYDCGTKSYEMEF